MTNLKQILMILGNRLVQERNFFPSSTVNSQLSRLKNEAIIGDDEAKRRYLRALSEDEGFVSTRPITEFTEWLNRTKDAQQILFELGFSWPMTPSDLEKSRVYDKCDNRIFAGNTLAFQGGSHKVYEIANELVICPFGEPLLVRVLRNEIVKVEE